MLATAHAVIAAMTLASGPAQPDNGAETVALADLPPAMQLGIKAEHLRRNWPVAPVVVVVEDEVSYLEAIGAWSPRARFPVLFDDGTPESAERVGRFVRGFHPGRVVRFTSDRAGALSGAPESRRREIERAVAGAWDMGGGEITMRHVVDAWRDAGIALVGAVVTDEHDPAWVAGVALAAGHAQPIVWADSLGRLGGQVSPDKLVDLDGQMRAGLIELGLAFDALTDEVDALCLCMGLPSKALVADKQWTATSDLIGRRLTLDTTGVLVASNDRWAWCGQVASGTGESSYLAMCALFLSVERAWVFDGYPESEPWSYWDGTSARDHLERAGLTVQLFDTPAQSADLWRQVASRPADGQLVLINSKGNRDTFHLEPGRLRTGDVPILNTPAIAHMVHSWSANRPDDRATIAARWLERGVFAYFGSVQEPGLQAFVPTPVLAARMVSSWPFGAAVRVDEGGAGKLATLGDPLITLGPPPPAADVDPELPGLTNLELRLKTALRAREYDDAVRTLVMLGRDREVTRLAAAVLRESPRGLGPGAARLALLPAFRAGTTDELLAAWRAMDEGARTDPPLRDALWLALTPMLTGSPTREIIDVLRDAMRTDQISEDAILLARAMARVPDSGDPAALIRTAMGIVKNQRDTNELRQELRRYW